MARWVQYAASVEVSNAAEGGRPLDVALFLWLDTLSSPEHEPTAISLTLPPTPALRTARMRDRAKDARVRAAFGAGEVFHSILADGRSAFSLAFTSIIKRTLLRFSRVDRPSSVPLPVGNAKYSLSRSRLGLGRDI